MKLSQVFLEDKRVVRRIIESVHPKEGDFFVEVGPGLGVLTFELLKLGSKLVAIELDSFLCMELKLKGVDVVCGDYLLTDVESLLKSRGVSEKVRFVSSVPYHITHSLLLKVFKERSLYEDVHLILQKEVVERLVAKEGSKAYGPFSILTQTLFHTQKLFNIPRKAFSPVPKVHSSLLRLVPREDRLNLDVESFLKFLKVPFKCRRKKLKNTLKECPKELYDLRPEDVPCDVWLEIFSNRI